MFNKIFTKYIKKNRSNSGKSQYCIDAIEQRESGLFITGWYLTDLVKEVFLMQKTGATVPHTIELLTRADVEEKWGKPAKGFQIHCSSESTATELNLHIIDCSGQINRIDLDNPVNKKLVADVKKVGLTPDTNITSAYCEYIVCYEESILVAGWVLEKQPIQRISIQSKTGKLIATGDNWLRLNRPDVATAFPECQDVQNAGILIRLDLKADRSSVLNKNLEIKIEFSNGSSNTNSSLIIDYRKNTKEGMEYLLNLWDPEKLNHIDAAPEIISPILQEIYNPEKNTTFERVNFGSAPKSPSTSIIIPLYGRYDFMRYQLSSFANFGGMDEVEILYIVDDPNITSQVLELAPELQYIFEQNFSVISLERNVGFGMANNIGVNQASGDNVILMNSDVLPDNSSWHEDLTDYLDTLDNAGIVGVRLLFEDDSIQHDGMAPMILPNYPNLLMNDHPKKGWPLSLAPKAAEPEPCLLVTAACIAMKKSLYKELNGFDPSYILGDFEDSDLCLRASQAGKTNYICRNISMHHLERQSQNLVDSGNWKHKVTMLNAVTYNLRWKTILENTFTKVSGASRNA